MFLSTAYISSPVTNCTFSNNDAVQGTALGTHNHEAVVKNCILWHENPENPNSMIFLDSQFSWNLLDISYSDLQNGEDGIEDGGTTYYTWGPGNLSLDPAFLPGTPDLSWQSPCIEAGTPDTSGLMLPLSDLAGNPRFVNARVDMGVFEYQLPVLISNSKFQVSDYFSVYPNPARDWVYIEKVESKQDAAYHLLNTEGELVLSGRMSAGQKTVEINISEVKAGPYLISITGDDFHFSGKLIKMN